MRCHFIPPYLIAKLAQSHGQSHGQGVAAPFRSSQLVDQRFRAGRAEPRVVRKSKHAWEIHTAKNGSTLPGTLVRSAGQKKTGDPAVDEAATGVSETLKVYADLGRDSYDDRGATVVTTVHYEKDYDNAFWDGTQLVVGDGDGTVFTRFTKPIDVLGHELSHAVTQFTANLTYSGQSGALNESMSDVFGICVKQRHLGEDATSGDWLIGAGIFLPGVNGRALRDMAAPGTAYDDPQLGKDPQVATLADYVQTSDDDGGVHINSGIPNLAFVKAAEAIGGDTLEGAGRIWYAALTSGLPADTDFAGFAAACVSAAGESAGVVRKAWAEVGVRAGAGPPGTSPSRGAQAAGQLEVTRTGGFAGTVRRGTIDLSAGDERAVEARALVERVRFDASSEPARGADQFCYTFCSEHGDLEVRDQAMTPDLRRLAALALED